MCIGASELQKIKRSQFCLLTNVWYLFCVVTEYFLYTSWMNWMNAEWLASVRGRSKEKVTLLLVERKRADFNITSAFNICRRFPAAWTIVVEHYPALEYFRVACLENLFIATTKQRQRRVLIEIYISGKIDGETSIHCAWAYLRMKVITYIFITYLFV